MPMKSVSDVHARQMNCMIHSMRDLVLWHNAEEEDAALKMAQPLGFGFEVDLGTRDWWLGGYSGVHFQRPWFNAGLRAQWRDIAPDEFMRLARETLPTTFDPPLHGPALPFQTEWTFVPFSRHPGSLIGDIHTAIALAYDPDGDRLYLRDRMVVNVHGFDEHGRGWVEVETLKEAFNARLRILVYEFGEAEESVDSTLLRLLNLSVDEMTRPRDAYAPGPHVHIAEGLWGISYFESVVRYFTPEHQDNPHSRYNFLERIPDGINAIIGDRLLLAAGLEAARDGLGEDADELQENLAESVGAWTSLRKESRRQGKGAEALDYARFADALGEVLRAETNTVATLERAARRLEESRSTRPNVSRLERKDASESRTLAAQ